MSLTPEQLKLLTENIKSERVSHRDTIISSFSSNDEQMIPLSNGNSKIIQAYLDTYRNANANTLRWYIIFCNYFTNLYDIETEDEQLREAFKQHLSNMFWFGTSAICKSKSGKYEAYGVVVDKIDANQQIVDFKTWINNLSFMGGLNDDLDNMKVRDGVAGKFNHMGIAGIWWFARLIKDIDMLMTSFRTNAIYNVKKLKYLIKNGNSDVIKAELRSLFRVDTPFTISIHSADDVEGKNTFEEIQPNTSSNIELMTQIKKYLGFMYNHMGIEFSSSDKAERSIGAEFEGEKIMATLMLREYKEEVERFIRRFNEKYKLNIKLIEVVEQIKEKVSEGVADRNVTATDEGDNE